jgi:peptidoglycan/LPS O-acetylase OafA/YrhL
MLEHESKIAAILQGLHRRIAICVETKNISPQTSHLLDASRAIAAGLVVLFHARIYTLGSAQLPPLYEFLYAPANCGSPAVFWFFVISGYLVGGAVIAEVAQTGNFDFRRYLISRMTRLYVVLLPALALGAFLDGSRIATWGINAHAGFETATSLSPLTLLGNVFYLQTILVQTFGSNWALWSLANEFWYYVTFPLLFAPLMIKRSLLQRVILFLVGAVTMLFIAKHNIGLPWLFTLWLLGAVVRFVKFCPIRSRALALSIAAVTMLAFPYLHQRIGLLSTELVGITFAMVIMQSHRQTTTIHPGWATVAKAFSNFSFSLYVVHLPLLHFIVTNIGQSPDPLINLSPSSAISLGVIAVLVGASYVVAFLFSQITERHTDDFRRLLLTRIPTRVPSR